MYRFVALEEMSTDNLIKEKEQSYKRLCLCCKSFDNYLSDFNEYEKIPHNKLLKLSCMLKNIREKNKIVKYSYLKDINEYIKEEIETDSINSYILYNLSLEKSEILNIMDMFNDNHTEAIFTAFKNKLYYQYCYLVEIHNKQNINAMEVYDSNKVLQDEISGRDRYIKILEKRINDGKKLLKHDNNVIDVEYVDDNKKNIRTINT